MENKVLDFGPEKGPQTKKSLERKFYYLRFYVLGLKTSL